MFLVRTPRTFWSSASAADAFAQAEAMRLAGHCVTLEKLGQRNLSRTELQRTMRATGPKTHHWSAHDFRS